MESEEMADFAVHELREFIETESQFVQEEHDLHTKLLSWDYIIIHLTESIPQEMTHVHALNDAIAEKLMEIREVVESGRLQDLKIIQEEAQTLGSIETRARNKDWRAVKSSIAEGIEEENAVLRLEEQELKDLHDMFLELMKLMKRSSLVSAIDADLTINQEKEKYIKQEEYYFLALYKFVRAYESVLRNLWRKERALNGKIKKV